MDNGEKKNKKLARIHEWSQEYILKILNKRDLSLTLSYATFIVMYPLVAILEVHSSWQQLQTADHISRLKT